MNTDRTYHSLFDTWSEHAAYILGFWYADGYITVKRQGSCYRKIWGLVNTNRSGLMAIKQHCGIDKPLTIRKKKQLHHRECYLLRVYSEQLFDFCYQYTGTTRKSRIQIALPPVPDNLANHFVRGFFDGDGSIYYTTTANRHGKPSTLLRSSFTAGKQTGDFLINLRELICTHIPASRKKTDGTHHKKITFGQYDTMLLCQWMYSGCSIAFENKKTIWDHADHARLAKSPLYFNKVASGNRTHGTQIHSLV